MKVSKHGSYKTYQPIYIIASLVLGACMGLFLPALAKRLEIAANMYMSLLQMCLIPLILTAIPVALSRIVKMRLAGRLFVRLIIVYVLTSIVCSLFGVACGLIGHWFHPYTRESLVQVSSLLSSESSINSADILQAGLSSFLRDLVPNNIFMSVVEGHSIQLLVFSVFLGISLGLLSMDVATPAVRVFRGIYKTFVNIASAILVILPLGLFFLIGAYIANFPHQTWETLRSMVVANLIGALVLGVALFWVLAYWLNRSFWYSLMRLKSVLLVSLFSFSGFTVLPLVLRLFGRNFDLDEEEVSLFYPLGVSLHPLGSIFFFSIFTVFIIGMYGYHLTGFDIVKIVLFSLFATIPIGGLYYRLPKGMLYVTMSLLLHPMGLPASTAVLLMVAGHMLFFPVVNMVNVIGNCLSVALIVRDKENQQAPCVALEGNAP